MIPIKARALRKTPHPKSANAASAAPAEPTNPLKWENGENHPVNSRIQETGSLSSVDWAWLGEDFGLLMMRMVLIWVQAILLVQLPSEDFPVGLA